MTAIFKEKNGNIWVGTNGVGLNLLNKQTGKFKRYLQGVSYINAIYEDSQGALWTGTGAGLFLYNKETDSFSILPDEFSLFGNSYVGWLVEDRDQNLWMPVARGIIKLNKERNNPVLYGKNQGVNFSLLSGFGYSRKNGELVFSDTLGYYSFQPDQQQKNIPAPVVTISNFLLSDLPVQPGPDGILKTPLSETKQIDLRHDQNTLSFEFSNIDFISQHSDTRLSYMLQNYDNNWRKGDEKKAYYFNLPPGKYVFKVRAYNAAGVMAEKNIDIIITPPWWKSWWAYTIFILLAAGLLRDYIVFRSRKLKRENKVLEEKVELRTEQLNKSIQNLKSTQTQLVQSEKMASLGELTAGIAHEIQNPLNFVNNFAEVNTELIDEAEREINNGNIAEVKSIFNNIRENERKISHHGKRADSIVKGMLLHSRGSSGVKEMTDINSLADEYLKLSFHGLRAKDKSFNSSLKTDFDETLPKINIVPQDIARVLVNLFNNAFYAVSAKASSIAQTSKERSATAGGFDPTVWLSTQHANGFVEISVKDNGDGIPQKVIDKIFQPFFTTKPAGQGTGLGLSLSYEIIKAHHGELKVDTTEGKGTSFTILLAR